MTIFDLSGEAMKTLVDELQQSGTYKVTWNGMNQNNERVSSGIYFYQLQIQNKSITKKAVYLK